MVDGLPDTVGAVVVRDRKVPAAARAPSNTRRTDGSSANTVTTRIPASPPMQVPTTRWSPRTSDAPASVWLTVKIVTMPQWTSGM